VIKISGNPIQPRRLGLDELQRRGRYVTETDNRWTINMYRLSTSIRTITKRHFTTVPQYF